MLYLYTSASCTPTCLQWNPHGYSCYSRCTNLVVRKVSVIHDQEENPERGMVPKLQRVLDTKPNELQVRVYHCLR